MPRTSRAIREERPDIVLTHDPHAGAPRYVTYQLHPDHRAVGFAAIDAVYFRAPGPLYYPDHAAAGLAPYRVGEMLLTMGDHHDHFVDISTTFARTVEAVRAHASQWGAHPDLEGFLRRRPRRSVDLAVFPSAKVFRRLTPG